MNFINLEDKNTPINKNYLNNFKRYFEYLKFMHENSYYELKETNNIIIFKKKTIVPPNNKLILNKDIKNLYEDYKDIYEYCIKNKKTNTIKYSDDQY